MIKKIGAMHKKLKEVGNCKKCYYYKHLEKTDTDREDTVVLDDCQYIHKPVSEAVLSCNGKWDMMY